MKRLLLILTGVTAANLLAKPISPRQALATASSFFSAKGELAKGNSNLQIVYTGTDESQARKKNCLL
ncbi:MAG: hypothetical protein EAS48_03720 [Chryseobacterium sp.]|nr:MAG: hypothetical protein EAS48_03720 [Chryseobacterium sp.]